MRTFVTDGLTDGRTDGRTDMTDFRGHSVCPKRGGLIPRESQQWPQASSEEMRKEKAFNNSMPSRKLGSHYQPFFTFDLTTNARQGPYHTPHQYLEGIPGALRKLFRRRFQFFFHNISISDISNGTFGAKFIFLGLASTGCSIILLLEMSLLVKSPRKLLKLYCSREAHH